MSLNHEHPKDTRPKQRIRSLFHKQPVLRRMFILSSVYFVHSGWYPEKWIPLTSNLYVQTDFRNIHTQIYISYLEEQKHRTDFPRFSYLLFMSFEIYFRHVNPLYISRCFTLRTQKQDSRTIYNIIYYINYLNFNHNEHCIFIQFVRFWRNILSQF